MRGSVIALFVALGVGLLFSSKNGKSFAPACGNVDGWGSSLIAGLGSELTRVGQARNFTYGNHAKGGELLTQTAARMGAIMPRLNFVGKPTANMASIEVSSPDLPANPPLLPYDGTLENQNATLSSSNGKLLLQLSVPGALPVGRDMKFTSAFRPCPKDFALINMGKNDLSAGVEAAVVNEQMDQVITWVSHHYKDYLVVGHFVNTGTSDNAGVRARIKGVNDHLRQRYSDHFLDLGRFLISPIVWKKLGIVPTTQDLAQQARGEKPASLSKDAGHLNVAGNRAVADLLSDTMASRGWFIQQRAN